MWHGVEGSREKCERWKHSNTVGGAVFLSHLLILACPTLPSTVLSCYPSTVLSLYSSIFILCIHVYYHVSGGRSVYGGGVGVVEGVFACGWRWQWHVSSAMDLVVGWRHIPKLLLTCPPPASLSMNLPPKHTLFVVLSP